MDDFKRFLNNRIRLRLKIKNVKKIMACSFVRLVLVHLPHLKSDMLTTVSDNTSKGEEARFGGPANRRCFKNILCHYVRSTAKLSRHPARMVFPGSAVALNMPEH